MSNTHEPLPMKLEAEKGLLGILLLFGDKNAFGQILHTVSEASFYAHHHKIIFRACLALHGQGKETNPILVWNWIQANKKIAADVRDGYLDELVEAVNSPGNLMAYADLITESERRRAYIAAAEFVDERARDEASPLDQVQYDCEQKIFDAATMGVAPATVSADQAVREWLEELDHRTELRKNGKTDVIQSGWDSLDKLTVGFHPGELIIIAARTGVGKTIAAANIALRTASTGASVFFATLEMRRVEMIQRMAGGKSRVDSWSMRHASFDAAERSQISNAAAEIQGLPLEFDDTPAQTVLQIGANARRLKSRGKLDMVIVDYLQLIESPERRRNDLRHEEVARITRLLKTLARDLKVPVIACAQLNRDAANDVPKLSHLRESGSIEQDADTVLLLHKPEAEDEKRKEDIVEIIVGKNRNGPTGKVTLIHEKPYFTIDTPEVVACRSRAA